MSEVHLPQSRFTQTHAAPLARWTEALANARGPIVAIARKGPRLLELLIREKVAPPTLLPRIITERALPFLDRTIDAAVVTDDSISYGSTFARIYSNVRQLLQGEGRDVDVTGLPLAVAARVAEDVREACSAIFIELRDGDEAAFVNNEIAAFHLLGKPYDLEHPILSFDIADGVAAADMSRFIEEFGRHLDAPTYSTTTPVAVANGLYNAQGWTILLPSLESGACEFAKVRFFLDATERRLTVTVMRPLALRASDIPALLAQLDPRLQQLGSELTDAAHRNAASLPPAVSEYSLIVCANFLAEATTLRRIRRALLAAGHGFLSGGHPSPFDVQLLVGPALAGSMTRALSEFYSAEGPCRLASPHLAGGVPATEKLPAAYASAYEQLLDDIHERSRTVGEAVTGIFQAQHVELEVASRRPGEDHHKRLDFGSSFGSIIERVRRVLPGASIIDIHAALDALIDTGAVVPRYVNFGTDADRLWVRAFRVGEGSTMTRAHGVAMLFRALASDAAVDEVPAVLFEKFAVLSLTVATESRALSQLQSLGVAKRFHLYGARASVLVDDRDEFLLDWAVSHKLLVRTRASDDDAEGLGTMYRLAPHVDRLFPVRECPWDTDVQYGVEDVASIANLLHSEKGFKSNALVTITSVASERELHKAVEAELRLWLYDPNASIYHLLRLFNELAEQVGATNSVSRAELDAANRILEQSANFTAQVKEKVRLFRERLQTLAKIDSLVADRNDRAIRRAWSSIRQTLANRGLNERATSGLDEILSALRVCHATTSLLRNLLAAAGREDELKRAKPMDVSVDTLRNLLNTESLDQVTSGVFASPNDAASVAALLSIAAAAKPASFVEWFTALEPAVRLIASKCEVILTNFGTTDRWVAPTVLEPPRYLLMWDVRDSTALPDRTPLERAVTTANARIAAVMETRALNFDPYSKDDGHGIICESFDDVMAVFRILQESLFDYSLRAGCEVNLQGRLNYYAADMTKRLGEAAYGGRAYEFAARVTTFFKEVEKDATRWLGEEQIPAEPASTYLVVGEFARRFAERDGCWPPHNVIAVDVPGMYVPRVHTGFPIRLTLLLPTTAAPAAALRLDGDDEFA